MVFLLSKFVTVLLKPLIWVLGLLVMSLLAKKAIRRKQFLVGGVALLFVFSNTAIINPILSSFEAKYEVYKQYDIGIVLGGYAGSNPRNGNLESYGSIDRLVQVVSLYKAGKIKKILISGGSAEKIVENKIEANVVAVYLKKIGIPDSALLIENRSKNTIENATNSFKVITKIQPSAKILVITSALHIPRAKVIFSKYFGNQVAYYPTDYRSKSGLELSDFIIPSANVLLLWELMLKEWVGLVVDRFRS